MILDGQMKTMTRIDSIKKQGFTYFEIIAAFVGFIILYLSLAFFATGGPLSTDVFWYTNAGINGIKDPFILNRYFHVFFQAVFLKLAPSPLVGLQHFWAFLLAGTSLLIYFSGRYFTRQTTPLHGLLGVGLFLSIGAFADTSGIPLVDITAMFMLMLIVSVYIASARRNHTSIWLLLFTGFLLFLAFKTKESTLAGGILLLGLGFTAESTFNLSLMLRRFFYIILGAVAGFIFFTMLSAVFLGDPFFGWRPAEISTFLRTYVHGAGSAEQLPGSDNWFTAYFLSGLWFPFLLYLISAGKAAVNDEIGSKLRLVWLVPLGVILFVTLTIGNQWGFLPRFIFPALPIISFLGPLFLNFDLQSLVESRARTAAILLFFFGLAFIFIFRVALRFFAPQLGMDIGVFLTVIFVPVLVSIILAAAFFWRHLSIQGSIVIALLMIAIFSIPVVENGKKMVRDKPNLHLTNRIFYPLSAFSDHIQYVGGMQVYVSMNTWNTLGVGRYANDQNKIASLFNIHFNSETTMENYTLSSEAQDIPQDLLNFHYNYAFLSMVDWQLIIDDPEIQSLIEQKYMVLADAHNSVVFLKSLGSY
jgi:hypothetical protein